MLMLLLVADRWAFVQEATAREQLRQSRVALQRAESRLATLTDAPGLLAAATRTREALALSILEAASGAASLPGVSDLQYSLDTDHAAISNLRLHVRATVVHEGAFLDLLTALRTLEPARPRRVAGCRLLRGDDALVVDCAIDWSWWAFA